MASTQKPPTSKKPKSKTKSLKTGRPPTATAAPSRLSSKATQKTIVTFHTLNKELEKAKIQSDHARISEIEAEIERLGGIKKYQQASIQGQALDRGGDSSVVLMQWLEPAMQDLGALRERFRMLEVGALSTKNECSRKGVFEIVRIDLNSQAQGIEQQDFMERPLPGTDDERFDIISLSLVLNFVPSAQTRGEMLRRTTAFLRGRDQASLPDSLRPFTGSLFLVLPAPCLLNSRYFNEERLTLIMASLGYALLHRKQTTKLVYHLWQLRDHPQQKSQHFPKVKLNDRGNMNNFHVILEQEPTTSTNPFQFS